MPKVGLSRPYIAEYVNNAGIISYQNGRRMGRAVEFSYEIEEGDGNDFYADNVVAETVSGVFTSGTLTMTTAELERAVSQLMLGLKTNTITIDGQQITELIRDDSSASPNLGFGVIIKEITYGITSWSAYVFRKIAFNIPGSDVTTQGEEIEWQTQETTARIMRDDSSTHQWLVSADNLSTEELADKYVRTKLGMPIESIGVLTVTSAAGSAAGTTAISVEPTLTGGNKYMIRMGANLTLPYFEQSVGEEEGYEPWDGAEAIVPPSGAQQILVVEANSSETAVKAGISAITVSDPTPEG